MRFCSSVLCLVLLHQAAAERISSRLSKKCIEIPYGNRSANIQVKQFDCLRETHFQLDARPKGDYFQLQFRHSHMCVSVKDGSTGAGALVVQSPCRDGVDSQLWQVNGRGKKKQVVVKHTGMCMTLANNDVRNGAGIIQFPCAVGAKNNYWKIKAKAPKGGNPPNRPTPPPPPPITPPAGGSSKWNGPYEMTIVPVAAANLPDGRILTWSAFSRMNFSGNNFGQTWIATFDPSNNQSSEALIEDTKHDMFCPGTAVLPDGRIAITGGAGSEALTIYNPADNSWTRGSDMKIERGYHSMTMLTDGSVFTLGGSFSGGRGGKDGEVWNPSNDSWQLKDNVKSEGSLLTTDRGGIFRSDNHMWLFTVPNGKVFHAGPSPRTHWITTGGAGSVTESIMRENSSAMNGNAVMYDIGKLLIMGGAEHYTDSDASNRAYVIDLNNGDNASVKQVGNMKTARAFHNSAVLPTGEVVVVGGQTRSEIFTDKNPANTAEIWNPQTGQFTELASANVPRTYHSTGILMKDGRVWVGGGGLCGTCSTNHLDSEILTPPYLLDGNGRPAVRPVIRWAGKRTRAGKTISVRMNRNAPHTFAVVRLSAVTHSINNDGRRFPLSIVSKNGQAFRLKIPNNRAVALAGSYFLFAMNGAGVPSVAKVLRIDP